MSFGLPSAGPAEDADFEDAGPDEGKIIEGKEVGRG